MKHFLYVCNSSVKIIFLSQCSSPHLIMNKLSMIFHPSYSEKPNIMPIFHKDSTSEGVLFCFLNLGMGPENWCTFYHEDNELAIFVLVFQNVLITDQKLNNNDWKDHPTLSETLMSCRQAFLRSYDELLPASNLYVLLLKVLKKTIKIKK